MNTRYWVVCTKQIPMTGHPENEVIQGIGTIQQPFGPYRYFTVEEVVKMRGEDGKGDQFFTVGVQRDSVAEVMHYRCSHGCGMEHHLRTVRDDLEGNNLDKLPYCYTD